MTEESKLTEKLEEKKSEVKFSEEEMKQVSDIQLSYADITNKFGQLSLTRIRLEQQLKSLSDTYNDLVKELTDNQDEEKKFLESINEKYGQGSLNPDTGVFTPTETTENKS